MNNGDEIDFVDEKEISWHCIKPIILRIRGKSIEIKNEEFKKLNEGQKAIFSFYVYYDHAKNDIDSFVYWSRLYIKNRFFVEIKNGARYFCDSDYSNVLIEIEGIFTGDNDRDIQKLYERFRIIGEEHKIKMGKMIVANKEYFYSYG